MSPMDKFRLGAGGLLVILFGAAGLYNSCSRQQPEPPEDHLREKLCAHWEATQPYRAVIEGCTNER